MQLTVFTDYALRCLMYLSQHDDRACTVREIAENYGISRNHMVKVVHRLSQLGYIASTKGKGGGIRLAHRADDLKLGDLVRQLEPHMHMVECFDQQHNTCKVVSSCRLKHYLGDANKAFIHSLNQHTVADAVSSSAAFLAAFASDSNAAGPIPR